jgi:hypothetical protein
VASIGRTAYPRFNRAVPVGELHEAFTSTAGKIAWAREQTRTPEHLLALAGSPAGQQAQGVLGGRPGLGGIGEEALTGIGGQTRQTLNCLRRPAGPAFRVMLPVSVGRQARDLCPYRLRLLRPCTPGMTSWLPATLLASRAPPKGRGGHEPSCRRSR